MTNNNLKKGEMHIIKINYLNVLRQPECNRFKKLSRFLVSVGCFCVVTLGIIFNVSSFCVTVFDVGSFCVTSFCVVGNQVYVHGAARVGCLVVQNRILENEKKLYL